MNIALKKGAKFVRENGQQVLYFTVDMQLYKIVIDILFYQPVLFQTIVPISGGLHSIMNNIHDVCVIFSPALKHILASTFGSVEKMMQGKKYPQNFRALKLLAEVILTDVLEKNPQIQSMKQLTDHLEAQSAKSKTTKLWVDCLIKPVFIWCAFLRAARENDLPLHYVASKAKLPYYPAGRGKMYTKYATFHVHHLEILPKEVIKQLKHDFSLRVIDGIWNCIHTDQFIETTYMRLGHGPAGAKGVTINQRQMEVWALSFAMTGEMVKILMEMTNDATDRVATHHKEESLKRIESDQQDRESLRQYMSGIIDPMDPSTHPDGHLLNIVSGQIAAENCNVHEAVAKGNELIKQYKESWPEGFYQTISQPVVLMDNAKRFVKIGENRVYDQTFIFARVSELMHTNREISMVDCLATELASYPPAYFDEDGKMRSTTKSKLTTALAVRVLERRMPVCDTQIYDVSALLWSIAWPQEGNPIKTYIKAFQVFVLAALANGNVILVFDRYFDDSVKAYQRLLRQEADGASRPHSLKPEMLSPPRSSILKVPQNKKQLNRMLVDALLDPEFYKLATQNGKTLTIAGVENYPIEITNGVKIDRKDIPSEHEEADPIIAQMAILACLKGEVVLIVSEDTDVFAMVLHFYVTEECKQLMYMKSPKGRTADLSNLEDRTVIDIKETAAKHYELAIYILQIHALTGIDCIPALFRIRKKRALNTLTCFKGEAKPRTKKSKQSKSKSATPGFFNPEALAPIGDVSADIDCYIIWIKISHRLLWKEILRIMSNHDRSQGQSLEKESSSWTSEAMRHSSNK